MQPTYIEDIVWKGTPFTLEFFKTNDISTIESVKRVAAVCFSDDEHVVLYKNIGGYFGLPGGRLEQNESVEEALRRELIEEATCEIEQFGLVGYIKSYKPDTPHDVVYQLIYWAKVKLLDETPDPDGKAIGREIVPLEEAADKLGWGEKGKYLTNLAREEYLK